MSFPSTRFASPHSTRGGSVLRSAVFAIILVSGSFTCLDAAEKVDTATRVSITPRAHAGTTARRTQGTIRLDVRAVMVPVTVTDSEDRPVSNLSKHDFQLFEENAEQQIVSLSSDDAPASVGV